MGVSIGGQTPQAFNSPHPTGVSFANPEQYRWMDHNSPQGSGVAADTFFRQMSQPEDESSGGSIGSQRGGATHAGMTFARFPRTHHARRAGFQRQGARDRPQDPAARRAYPNNKLADSLSLVARMIAGGLPTRVYYVSHGGYDTHQGQERTRTSG